MEILIVVVILGILTAFAVPVFFSSVKKQKINECANQRTVISTAVKQAMHGMIDNGKKQEIIDFSKMQSDYYSTYEDDGIAGNSDDEYDGKRCFVLWYTKFNPTPEVQMHTDTGAFKQQPMTLATLRGGYRPLSEDDDRTNGLDYDEGCQQGYFLKKKKYTAHQDGETWVEATKFYVFLNSEEIPVCPFVEDDYSRNGKTPDQMIKAPEYMYFVFEDGTVLCSCPDCH